MAQAKQDNFGPDYRMWPVEAQIVLRNYLKDVLNKSSVRRIPVNKTTHRIRFENETESEVVVVIEPKDNG